METWNESQPWNELGKKSPEDVKGGYKKQVWNCAIAKGGCIDRATALAELSEKVDKEKKRVKRRRMGPKTRLRFSVFCFTKARLRRKGYTARLSLKLTKRMLRFLYFCSFKADKNQLIPSYLFAITLSKNMVRPMQEIKKVLFSSIMFLNSQNSLTKLESKLKKR